MVKLNIEALLSRCGKSKYWLVKELGSNYTVINKMIAGEQTAVRFDTIDKLMNIFDCDFNDLFTFTPPEADD